MITLHDVIDRGTIRNPESGIRLSIFKSLKPYKNTGVISTLPIHNGFRIPDSESQAL
ncbi:hypothetical protein KJ652_03270 [Patescibacteria group bacterium]|nr:hypothetical protein [Patescibacteria group bacterium]MBU1123588.1 hypothetical protein [Patescibacteria group bacterium]